MTQKQSSSRDLKKHLSGSVINFIWASQWLTSLKIDLHSANDLQHRMSSRAALNERCCSAQCCRKHQGWPIWSLLGISESLGIKCLKHKHTLFFCSHTDFSSFTCACAVLTHTLSNYLSCIHKYRYTHYCNFLFQMLLDTHTEFFIRFTWVTCHQKCRSCLMTNARTHTHRPVTVLPPLD